MSRILLDQNVPHGLRRLLADHEVSTAYRRGWAALSNGDLLAAAEEAGFAVMITCDQSIPHQQNMTGRKIAVIVLSTNDLNVIRAHGAAVTALAERIGPGGFQFAELTGVPSQQ